MRDSRMASGVAACFAWADQRSLHAIVMQILSWHYTSTQHTKSIKTQEQLTVNILNGHHGQQFDTYGQALPSYHLTPLLERQRRTRRWRHNRPRQETRRGAKCTSPLARLRGVCEVSANVRQRQRCRSRCQPYVSRSTETGAM